MAWQMDTDAELDAAFGRPPVICPEISQKRSYTFGSLRVTIDAS